MPPFSTTPRSCRSLRRLTSWSYVIFRYTMVPISARCFMASSEYTAEPPVAMMDFDAFSSRRISFSTWMKPSGPHASMSFCSVLSQLFWMTRSASMKS